MVKPLWALTGITLLGTAGTVGALFITTQGSEEEVLQGLATASPEFVIASHAPGSVETPPHRTPGPPMAITCDANSENTIGGRVFRWGDVLLGVPDGSGIVVARGDPKAVELIIQDDYGGAWSSVQLDSKTGEMIYESIDDLHRAQMAEVVASRMICPFDAATAPWPYAASRPASLKEERIGGFSVVRADPASGIEIDWATADGVAVDGGGLGNYLIITSARSRITVWDRQGTRYTPGVVHPDDKNAFERLTESVRKCGADGAC